MVDNPQVILNFWFQDIDPKAWWSKNEAFDEKIRQKFAVTHTAATKCELSVWRKTPQGRLAEILVLDQFSRNMFRDRPEAFAFDTLALVLTQEALNVGAEKALSEKELPFLLMPMMHSESKIIHEQAVPLFSKWAPGNLDYEMKHKAIIDRFGRYPHRNEILGRASSKEEIEFLKQPGSSF